MKICKDGTVRPLLLLPFVHFLSDPSALDLGWDAQIQCK
jgi:hypothetical protein